MDANLGRKPLELTPLDPPAAGADSSRPATPTDGHRDLRITSADDCLARAASEYQGGQIDQPLWDRTSAQAGNDEALAVAAYLRARATALRLKLRDERAEKASVTAPVPDVGAEIVPLPIADAPQSRTAATAPAFGRRKIIIATAALASAVVVAAVAMIAMPRDAASPPPVAIARTAAAAPAPVPQRPSNEPSAAPAPQVDPTLEMKVQQLKGAGNWNVLVLYASEWTRKEPDNAAAWTDLSLGFTKMRQFGDALDSATKAVTLSPQDARAWVNLGQVNLVLERLPEARGAYEKVLALDPEHPEALCAATSIAKRQSRAKDAEGLAARLKSTTGGCGDANDGVEIAVSGAGASRKGGR